MSYRKVRKELIDVLDFLALLEIRIKNYARLFNCTCNPTKLIAILIA